MVTPGLTLTYFTCFCTKSGPRYQVSVYRTIGPLVCDCCDISCAIFVRSQCLPYNAEHRATGTIFNAFGMARLRLKAQAS